MNFSRFFGVFFGNCPQNSRISERKKNFFRKNPPAPLHFGDKYGIMREIGSKKGVHITMSDFNTFEFVVDERPEGKRKALKFWGRFALLAFVAIWVIVSLCTIFYLAVLPLCLLGLVLYFWKIFNCELEYSMTSGQMTFSRIYGGLKRKKVLDVTIKDFREVAPRTADSDAKLKARGISKTYMFASHSTAIDQYYATFEENGQLCAVYFEATEKTLKILRYYNPVTVVTKVSR